MDIGGRTTTVSTDRLKPACVGMSQPVQVSVPKPRGRPKTNPQEPPQHGLYPSRQPQYYTRSGRRVRKPQQYSVLEGSGVAA